MKTKSKIKSSDKKSNQQSTAGKLIIIDGPENVGCSTQSALLVEAFQRAGHPTLRVGLGASDYIGNDLEEIKKVHPLRPHTVSLFHATEIADQVEKKIKPALKAGFIVVADRLHYSVISQNIVRGVSAKWLKSVFKFADILSVGILLKAEPEELAQRSFSQQGTLGFWDSGQDCVVRDELYEGFIEYQSRQKKVLKKLCEDFSLISISASDSIETTHKKIAKAVVSKLGKNLNTILDL
jgi:dTMP kinase